MTVDIGQLREGDAIPPVQVVPQPEQVQRSLGHAAPTFFSDEAAAKAMGLPGRIVPGHLKVGILYSCVESWLGDLGWVVAVRAAHRRPDLQGAPVTVAGTIARLYEEGGKQRADLEMHIINQEGQPSVRGFATVEFWGEAPE